MTKRTKNRLSLLSLVIILLLAGCSGLNQDNLVSDDSDYIHVDDSTYAAHVPGQIVVKVRNNSAKEAVINQVNGELAGEIEALQVLEVNLPANMSIKDAIEKVKTLDGVVYAQPQYLYQLTSDDPRFEDQWNMQTIHAIQAWEETRGSEDVVIAVIDSGIDKDHLDLGGKVVGGYNFAWDYEGFIDSVGHGTHVSGIAAGVGNNDFGIAGLAWNTPLLACKAFTEEGGRSTDIADAIVWAVDWANTNGKRLVINMSFGGPSKSLAMQDAIDYALDNNVVLVAAMGNTGKYETSFPAATPGVIAVGAIDGNGQLADFSTRGDWISLVAPGVKVLSTLPGNTYAAWDGTSMATPHVTGAVALLLSANPALTTGQVKRILEASADPIGNGFTPEYGHGVLNVEAALAEVIPAEPGAIEIDVVNPNTGDPILDATVVLYNQETGEYVNSTKTNNNGEANFYFLDPGSYKVTVSKLKIVQMVEGIVISDGTVYQDTLEMNFPAPDSFMVHATWETAEIFLYIQEPDGSRYTFFDGETANGSFSGGWPQGYIQYDLKPLHEPGEYIVSVENMAGVSVNANVVVTYNGVETDYGTIAIDPYSTKIVDSFIIY
ncbi:MAG: S8 family serine peptidase [Halanaerobium sp.]|nr:S8 family serine peptidase [Halanaerobium sp.]